MRDEAVDSEAGELEEAEGVGHTSESALTASRHREGRRSTREWLNTVRNGWVVRESVAIFKLTVPMVATNFFYQIMFTVALVFAGHITGKSLELDAAALALSVSDVFASFGGLKLTNVTGVSVGVGLSTALETLCSQMYGFKNYKGVGIVTQRAIWILGLAMFPVLIVWLNTESLLLLIQQDPCVARLTGLYVRIFASCLPALFLFLILQRYLYAQSIVLPFLLVGVVNNIVSAGLHGILIYWADLGLSGSAIAISISTITSPFVLLLYIRLRNIHRNTWGGWSYEGLRGWGQFVRLGIPGLLMVCFEWWCFELAAFVTGSISKTQLAIHTVLLQILSLNFMLPYGVSMALTVRVGNELGAGNPQKAKQATYTAFGITCVQALFVVTLLASTRTVLGKVFSKDEDVIRGVAKVTLIAIPLILSDSLQAMIQGVLKGTGKQMSGAVLNFVAYYVVGFPVGVVLAVVVGMGTLGMWIGLLLGSVLQMTFYLVVVWRLNWDKESLLAIERARTSTAEGSAQSGGREVDEESVSTVSTEEGGGEGEREREGEGEGKGEEEGQGEGEGEGQMEEEEGAEEDAEHLAFRRSFNNFAVTALTHSSEWDHVDGRAIEEVPLMSLEEENVEQKCSNAHLSSSSSTGHKPSRTFHREVKSEVKTASNLKLVLSRLSLFAVAVALLGLGGVASHYRPHRPLTDYCECESGNGSWNGTKFEEWTCVNTSIQASFGIMSSTPNPTKTETFYLLPTSSPLLAETPYLSPTPNPETSYILPTTNPMQAETSYLLPTSSPFPST